MKAHPALTDEHEALRDTMRRFVQREMMPHAAAWDEAEEFPRALQASGRRSPRDRLCGGNTVRHAGGLVHACHPVGGDCACRSGRRARRAVLASNRRAADCARRERRAEGSRAVAGVGGREDQRARASPSRAAARTSRNLRTAARLDGGDYVVNGEKTFITSGMRAHSTPSRCAPRRAGRSGVSLLLIEREREGIYPHAAEENGLVVLRHGHAAIPTMCACRPAT